MSDVNELLQQVQKLRGLLTDVATGVHRIQDVEPEYTVLRRSVALELKSLKVADQNKFQSLWDWYNYWKENGLTSYQSRRNYVSSLYRPTTEALEALLSGAPSTETQSFSRRHGYSPNHLETPVTIYEDAPPELREVLLGVAAKTGWDTDALLRIATRIGKHPWEAGEAIRSEISSRTQLGELVARWPWYEVYEFIELLATRMREWEIGSDEVGYPCDDFESILNEYFRHAGIGWLLENGQLKTRGSETFRVALARSAAVLKETPHQTAEREIHEALSDLSRRPTPDLTGSIQHAMAALECVARMAANDPSPTLGKLLKHHPGLIPPPLDAAIEKAWGYASNMGRHLEEGYEPTREEAELIVGVATVVATYLGRKHSKAAS